MTAIAINDLSPRKQHIATAGATTFVYDFPILATADLLVYKTLAANTGDDDDDLLTYGVDYTLTGVGTATGGTIVLTSGAAAGDIITAMRARAYSRAATFSLSAAISSQILDEEMNHLLLLIQQVNAKVEKLQTKYNNCSVLSETKDKILPVLAAKQTWRMNTAGTDIEAVTVEETGEAETLRADLAEATVVADGARLIGFNDGSSGATNVHAALSPLPAQIISALSQISSALSQIAGIRIKYGNATGINNYAVTISDFTSHNSNQLLLIDFQNPNSTTTPTLSINGGAPIPVRYADPVILRVGDLLPQNWTMLKYTDAAGGILHVVNPYSSYRDMGVGVRGLAEYPSVSEVKAEVGSKCIAPDQLKYSPVCVKAWGVVAGSGALASSYNILSVVRQAAGVYIVTLGTAFPNNQYTVVATLRQIGLHHIIEVGVINTQQFEVQILSTADLDFSFMVCGYS